MLVLFFATLLESHASEFFVARVRPTQSVNLDIPVDLPYSRVVDRFFKVPHYLAKDYLVRLAGTTANTREWQPLFHLGRGVQRLTRLRGEVDGIGGRFVWC